MNGSGVSHRSGGFAALTQTLLILVVMAMFGLVLPRQGFTPDQFDDFAKVIPVMKSFDVVNVVAVVRGLDFVVLAIVLFERARMLAPQRMLLVLVSAGMTATLLCAQGMLGLVGWPALLSDPATAPVAGAALQAASSSLIDSAFVTQGVFAVVLGWVGLSTRTMPAALGGLIILAGLLIVLLPTTTAVLIPGMVVWVAWTSWLGVVLLTRSPSMSPGFSGPG